MRLTEALERCAEDHDAAIGESTFGSGSAVFVGKREVAYLSDTTTVDIRLTKAVIRERREDLRRDDRVELRRGQSDWAQFTASEPDDLATLERLVAAAIEANRESAPEGLPPTGSELERRRRFH